MGSDHTRQISELERKMADRLERESMAREQNVKEIIDEVTKATGNTMKVGKLSEVRAQTDTSSVCNSHSHSLTAPVSPSSHTTSVVNQLATPNSFSLGCRVGSSPGSTVTTVASLAGSHSQSTATGIPQVQSPFVATSTRHPLPARTTAAQLSP